MSQTNDSYFVAWRSKDSAGKDIFGSLIYNAAAGTKPAQVLIDVMSVITYEHGVLHQDVRITAFNRV